MIDKDQDGYVSMAEAYIAANNSIERGIILKVLYHQNVIPTLFSGEYTDGNSPQECDKCMRWMGCLPGGQEK